MCKRCYVGDYGIEFYDIINEAGKLRRRNFAVCVKRGQAVSLALAVVDALNACLSIGHASFQAGHIGRERIDRTADSVYLSADLVNALLVG